MVKRGGGGGGGKGKGPKPQFTRVIPKFLQQYTHLLTDERRPFGADAEGAPTTVEEAEGTSGLGAKKEGGGKGSDFGDYDDDEVAALEMQLQQQKRTPEEKEALRRKIASLSQALSAGAEAAEETAAAAKRKREGVDDEESKADEIPKSYVNDDGTIKFNKPGAGGGGGGGGKSGGAVAAGAAAGAGAKRAKKRPKITAVQNKGLLSFGDDEEG